MLIVDGYNLLFAFLNRPGKRDDINLEFSRETLINLLRTYNTTRDYRILVVFDGKDRFQYITEKNLLQNCRGGKRKGFIKVLFSSAGESADELIVKIVEANRRKHKITVVTSDRMLTESVHKYKVETLSSDNFITQINKFLMSRRDKVCFEHPGKQKGLKSKSEINFWLKVFGYTEDDVVI